MNLKSGSQAELLLLLAGTLGYFWWKARPAIENTAKLANEVSADAVTAYEYVAHGGLSTDISDAATAAENWVSTEVDTAEDWVSGEATSAYNATAAAFDAVADEGRQILQSVENVYTGGMDTISAAEQAVIDEGNSIIDSISSTASSVEQSIENGARSAWNEATDDVHAVEDWFSDLFSSKPKKKKGKGKGKK